MIRFRPLLLIVLLCHTVLYVNCDDQTEALKNGPPIPRIDHNEKDSKNVVREQREVEIIDPGVNANDLTEDERSARCTLLGRSRRPYLRTNDADQVANYFLRGGPVVGHAHFIGASNPQCESNNDDQSNVVGMSNPNKENYAEPPKDNKDLNNGYQNSIVGVPHTPVLYPISRPLPPAPHSIFSSFLRAPTVGAPHSILHPHLHPPLHGLHTVPHTLFRAASLPIHGLMNARSMVHNLIYPGLPVQPHGQILGSPNPAAQRNENVKKDIDDTCLVGASSPTEKKSDTVKSSTNNEQQNIDNSQRAVPSTGLYSYTPGISVMQPGLFNYPEPMGYMVRVVPHNTQSLSTSPVVGSTYNPPSNCNNEPTLGASNPKDADQTTKNSTADNKNDGLKENESEKDIKIKRQSSNTGKQNNVKMT